MTTTRDAINATSLGEVNDILARHEASLNGGYMPAVVTDAAYGAVGDGVADDTAAFVAALATGKPVYAPAGTYLVSADSLVCSTQGQRIYGAGRFKTTIKTTSTTGVLFEVTNNYVVFEDMTLSQSSGSAATAGAGIKLTSGTFPVVERVNIDHFFYNFECVGGSSWTLRNCYITSPYQYSVYQRNIGATDLGNTNVIGCTFDTGVASAAAIQIESGGGMRVTASKFLNHPYCIRLQVADGVATSVLPITGNSFENFTTAAIYLGRLGTTGTFSRIAIVGNQFTCVNTDAIQLDAGISEFNVSANTVFMSNAANYGVKNIAATNGYIGANYFEGPGTGIGLIPTSGGTNVSIGPNQYHSCTVTIEDNTSRNQSPGPIDQFYRRTAAGVTSSVTYTNLWRVSMNTSRGCKLSLTLEGFVSGPGAFSRQIELLVMRSAAANCTLSTISDTALGAVIDVQFDTTTTGGSVIIGVKLNAAGGGTQLDGTLSLRANGHILKVVVL